jgi:hypothetical protein
MGKKFLQSTMVLTKGLFDSLFAQKPIVAFALDTTAVNVPGVHIILEQLGPKALDAVNQILTPLTIPNNKIPHGQLFVAVGALPC